VLEEKEKKKTKKKKEKEKKKKNCCEPDDSIPHHPSIFILDSF
jgi:hypothetical protein